MAQRIAHVGSLAAAALIACAAAGDLVAEPFDVIGDLIGGGVEVAQAGPIRTTGAIERRSPLAPPVERSALPAPSEPARPKASPSVEPLPPAAARPAPPFPAPSAPASDPDGYPVDLLIALANDAVYTADPYPKGRRSDPRMIKLQVLLDRNNASPGVIDGMFGDNVVKAVRAFEEMLGHPVDGKIDRELWAALEAASDEPVLGSYILTDADVAGPFVAEMPHDYALQAQLAGLSYRDAAEMLAERFHMDEAFLRRLNPDVTFAEAGVAITVANVGKPLKAKVAHIVADKARKQLRGYDAAGKLVVAYPATIGSSDTPSPTGTHAVKAIAINPEYWYRPKVNFVQGANTRALRLPPGPNGPVGATWVGLDKPTYGLHGTPEPSKIDKTNSHGCVRLTNWDARELAGLVAPGVPVDFQEPPAAAPIEETPMAEQAPAEPLALAPPPVAEREPYVTPDAQVLEEPAFDAPAPARRIPALHDRRAQR